MDYSIRRIRNAFLGSMALCLPFVAAHGDEIYIWEGLSFANRPLVYQSRHNWRDDVNVRFEGPVRPSDDRKTVMLWNPNAGSLLVNDRFSYTEEQIKSTKVIVMTWWKNQLEEAPPVFVERTYSLWVILNQVRVSPLVTRKASGEVLQTSYRYRLMPYFSKDGRLVVGSAPLLATRPINALLLWKNEKLEAQKEAPQQENQE